MYQHCGQVVNKRQKNKMCPFSVPRNFFLLPCNWMRYQLSFLSLYSHQILNILVLWQPLCMHRHNTANYGRHPEPNKVPLFHNNTITLTNSIPPFLDNPEQHHTAGSGRLDTTTTRLSYCATGIKKQRLEWTSLAQSALAEVEDRWDYWE